MIFVLRSWFVFDCFLVNLIEYFHVVILWILFYVLGFKLLEVIAELSIFYSSYFILSKIHFSNSLQLFRINIANIPINKLFIFNLKKILIQLNKFKPLLFLFRKKLIKRLNIHFLKTLIIQVNIVLNLFFIVIFKQI